MSQNRERSRFWQVVHSPLAFIVLFIMFIFMARAAWSVYNHELTSSRDRERIEKDLVAANKRLAALQKQIAVLETPQGVDEEIRSKFNVSKAGEGVAVIVGAATDSAGSAAVSVSFADKNWWQKFLGFLGL